MNLTTRTVLLFLHISAAACWLGADVVLHVISPRLRRDPAASLPWARVEAFLHERYYAVVVLVLFASGVGLVQDGGWSWGSGFIWVGITAVVGGATLGGGGLGTLAKRRLAALEADDRAGADAVERPFVRLGLVVTLLPIVTILAMVGKWGV